MTIPKINSSNFNEKISKGKTLIKYSTSWCAPCRQLAPIIEELSKEIKDINFYEIDADESPDIASQYDVMGIPTLILFNNGKEIRRIVGLRSKEEIKKELK